MLGFTGRLECGARKGSGSSAVILQAWNSNWQVLKASNLTDRVKIHYCCSCKRVAFILNIFRLAAAKREAFKTAIRK